jgi:hypothetical protein
MVWKIREDVDVLLEQTAESLREAIEKTGL